MRREDHLSGDINDRLPIIPHENLEADCCGCLYVHVEGGRPTSFAMNLAEVIRTVPVEDVETVVKEIAQTDTICRARCAHCGASSTNVTSSPTENSRSGPHNVMYVCTLRQ